jgi:hypothetical protein
MKKDGQREERPHPAAPTAHPATPTTHPATPTNQPAALTTHPGTPTNQPATLTTYPATPTTHLGLPQHEEDGQREERTHRLVSTPSRVGDATHRWFFNWVGHQPFFNVEECGPK